MILLHIVFLLTLHVACQALMYDHPCDIVPSYNQGGIPEDPDYMSTLHVAGDCMNGTLYWDYPRGHAMVHFPNPHQYSTAVCFKDFLGGDIFTITDRSEGSTNKQVDDVNRNIEMRPFFSSIESWGCTDPNTVRDIVLQVDAPVDVQYYMGALEYRLQQQHI